METFFALLVLCAGNSPVTCEFPSQRPVTRNLEIFVDLCLNKRLSKQPRRRWFEPSSTSLWRHCNVLFLLNHPKYLIWNDIRNIKCPKPRDVTEGLEEDNYIRAEKIDKLLWYPLSVWAEWLISLRTFDAVWRHKSASTLARVRNSLLPDDTKQFNLSEVLWH